MIGMPPTRSLWKQFASRYQAYKSIRDYAENGIKDVFFVGTGLGLLYSCYQAGPLNTIKGLGFYSGKFFETFKNIYADATKAKLKAKGAASPDNANAPQQANKPDQGGKSQLQSLSDKPLEQLDRINQQTKKHEHPASTALSKNRPRQVKPVYGQYPANYHTLVNLYPR